MLQGARHSHITALDRAAVEAGISVEVVELRTEDDLSNTSSWIDAVVLPGGESTTMRLTGGPVEAGGSGLLPALFAFLRERPALPVLATCAGAILLSDPQDGGSPLIDATIDRNAYGRQVDSFQALLEAPALGRSFPGIFIRAPRFSSVGPGSKPAALHNGEVVGVTSESRLALAFHPELTDDVGFHRHLLSNIIASAPAAAD